MNVSLYILSSLKGTYEQYPNDVTRTTFRQIASLLKSEEQFFIAREGNILYYAYIKKIAPRKTLFGRRERFWGFGMQINGVALKDIAAVIREFRNAMTYVAMSGILLEYDENAEIVPLVNSLVKNQKEVTEVLKYLADNAHLENSIFALPQIEYGSSINSVLHCTDKENFEDIAEKSLHQHITTIDFVVDKERNLKNDIRFKELLRIGLQAQGQTSTDLEDNQEN